MARRGVVHLTPDTRERHEAMRIAILVPCYNEALIIGKVLRDFRAAAPDVPVFV